MQSETFNTDCMKYMATLPDKAFDVAIVDPPYGIGATRMNMGSGKNKQYLGGADWDSQVPEADYFKELFRVSKNQIIWGGNYFRELPPSKSWIVWDKGIDGEVSFADGELAWTSFDRPLRIAKIRYKGFLGADKDFVRFHPTAKPINLYAWVINHYCQKGDRILDTHLGSGSSRIAAYKLGFDFTGIEIDKRYFSMQEERFRNECILQQSLF